MTTLVNEMVSNGRINMTIGNHTMGGDPEWGQAKSFYALVAYEGKIFNLNLFEGEEINIPDNLDNGGGSSGGGSSGGGSRSINWNDTDLFYSKSFTQQDMNGSVFRSYDLLLKSRENFSSQVQTLNLPDGSSLSSITNEQFVKEGSHYIFEHSFTSNADLFSHYPSGEYNWNIGSSNGSNYVEHTLNTNDVEYPTITPSIIGGKWEGGKLLVDPHNPVIGVSQWSGSDANDRVEWGYWTAFGGAGGASSLPANSTIDFNWISPTEGQDYYIYLFYVDVLSEQQNTDLSGDQYNARFGAVSALYFTITISARGREPTLSEILLDPSSFGLVSQSDANASEEAAFERGYIQGFYDGNLSVIQNPGDFGFGRLIDFNESLSVTRLAYDQALLDANETAEQAIADAKLLAKAEGITEGKASVTSDPASYSLVRKSVHDKALLDANETAEQAVADAQVASKAEGITIGRSEGEQYVIGNPSAYNLFTSKQYEDALQSLDTNATPYTPSWFFIPEQGWMWSQKGVYPYFYDANSSNWMYFQSGHDNPRFYHYGTKEWMTLE